MSGGWTDEEPLPSQAAHHQRHLVTGNLFIKIRFLFAHMLYWLILLVQMGQVQAQLQGQQSQAAALQQALRAAQAQHAQVQLTSRCKSDPYSIYLSCAVAGGFGNRPSYFAVCNHYPTNV